MSGVDEAVRRAAAWLAGHGDPLVCRCAAVLAGVEPREGVLAELGLEPASVSQALARLRLLDDLGALGTPAAERVVAFLVARQGEDGSWAGGAERVLTTATVAGELGKTPFVKPSVLDEAGAFLAPHWSPERVQGFDLPAVAAWSVFFANVLHELADEGLQWCGRELERGYRTGRFDPVETARVLLACGARALPGGRVAAPELVEAVCASQRDDGSFGAPPRTYDALAALVRLA